MDVNTGDIRAKTTFCGLRIWNNVRKTRFSREVRRLGVAAAENPVWRLARTEEGLLMGTHSHARFDPARLDLEGLIKMFAHGKVPDAERVVILQEILRGLTKKPGPGPEVWEQYQALEDRVYK